MSVALALSLATSVLAEEKARPSLEPNKKDSLKLETVRGLLPTDRIIVGTVEDVQGEQIKVNIGELQPRFLPLEMAKDKGFPAIKKGDQLVLTVNDQNLVVDFHPWGHPGEHHIVRGALVTPLAVGHDRAVIRTKEGKEQELEIRPLARSRVAALSVGTSALFLLDESNKIADAFFGSEEALARSEREYMTTKWQGSPMKGAHTRIPATIVKSAKDGHITVRTEEGKEQTYQIRPTAQEKFSALRDGEKVILLVDEETKIIDMAVPEKLKK